MRDALLKAGTDPDFRKGFLDRSYKSATEWYRAVLPGYDLTQEEITCLYEINGDDKLAAVCMDHDKGHPIRASDIRF
jgi:hypothetical protein